MVLEVYLDPCTINCRKVLSGLDLIGAQYNVHHIDYFTGQQKSPEYMKINPHATVPAAVDGDLVITESNAIMMYAADTTGGGPGSPAYPKDLKHRADINRWLLWEASVWFGSCYIYLVENVVKPLLKAEPDQKVIDEEAPKFQKNAAILDARLAKNKFLTGPEVTIADIAVASPMHLWEASKLPLDKYPNLKRWYKDMEAIPAWSSRQAVVNKALLGHE